MKNRFLILAFIPAFLLTSCVVVQSTDSQNPINFEISTDYQILQQGSCFDRDGKHIDLEKIKRSDGLSSTFPSSNIYPHLKINGDKIFFSTASNSKKNISNGFINIRDYLERKLAEDGLDIELSFVELESVKKIYWKETYQNRSYHQGILRYIDGAVESECIGRGGSDSAH